LFCSTGRSVALGTTGVGEAVTLHGDKLPLVALRVQGELEDAVDTVDAHLAVRDRGRDRPLASAAPPVPTTNWRMPPSGSALPCGSCGAKRS
jgi:hypothetical protein